VNACQKPMPPTDGAPGKPVRVARLVPAAEAEYKSPANPTFWRQRGCIMKRLWLPRFRWCSLSGRPTAKPCGDLALLVSRNGGVSEGHGTQRA